MFKTLMMATALTLAGAGAAYADPPAAPAADANVPLCSKTVTDACMNPSQAPKAAKTHAMHHKAKAHRPATKTKTAAK